MAPTQRTEGIDDRDLLVGHGFYVVHSGPIEVSMTEDGDDPSLAPGQAAHYEAPSAADSAPTLGLNEGNTKGQKSHGRGGQREKGAPRPAQAGRLE